MYAREILIIYRQYIDGCLIEIELQGFKFQYANFKI